MDVFVKVGEADEKYPAPPPAPESRRKLPESPVTTATSGKQRRRFDFLWAVSFITRAPPASVCCAHQRGVLLGVNGLLRLQLASPDPSWN